MNDPREIFKSGNDGITAMVDKFVAEVESRLEAAKFKVEERLRASITEKGGKLVMDGKTTRALRRIDKMLIDAMEELHYSELVDAFVAQFGRIGFKSLNQILKAAKIDPVKFSKAQMDAFAAQQANVADNLEGLLKNAAELLKRRASFSIGAVTVKDLTGQIASALKTGFAQARTLADTSMTMFLRNVHSTGYEQIERSGTALKYRYVGPIDAAVSHPLCKRLLAHPDTLYSRAEIDAMTNGQLPDVFLTGGGYNCRHWWIVGAVNDRTLASSAKPVNFS